MCRPINLPELRKKPRSPVISDVCARHGALLRR